TARLIQINHNEVDAAAICLIKLHSASRLSFGIETSFSIDNDEVGAAGDGAILQMISGDERAILAVAGVIHVSESHFFGSFILLRATISEEDSPCVATAVIPWTMCQVPPSFLMVMAKRSRDSMLLPSTREMSGTS